MNFDYYIFFEEGEYLDLRESDNEVWRVVKRVAELSDTSSCWAVHREGALMYYVIVHHDSAVNSRKYQGCCIRVNGVMAIFPMSLFELMEEELSQEDKSFFSSRKRLDESLKSVQWKSLPAQNLSVDSDKYEMLKDYNADEEIWKTMEDGVPTVIVYTSVENINENWQKLFWERQIAIKTPPNDVQKVQKAKGSLDLIFAVVFLTIVMASLVIVPILLTYQKSIVKEENNEVVKEGDNEVQRFIRDYSDVDFSILSIDSLNRVSEYAESLKSEHKIYDTRFFEILWKIHLEQSKRL